MPIVAVKVYVPDAATVTKGIVGFCTAELNELGPDQLYERPVPVVPPVRFAVKPEQTGLVFEAVVVMFCGHHLYIVPLGGAEVKVVVTVAVENPGKGMSVVKSLWSAPLFAIPIVAELPAKFEVP